MPKTLIAKATINPALLAFKPRQVLISTPPHMGKQSKTLTLESEQKALLLRSVAHYLDRCGFSKCFKKLLSEAEIEKKELNSDLPNLEEIYLEFLKKKNQEAVEVKNDAEDGKKKAGKVDDQEGDKKEEAAVNGSTEATAMEGVEKVKKDKKKKKKEAKLEVAEEEKVKEADAEVEDGEKDKKKKKKKSKPVEAHSLGDDDKEKVKEADAEIEDGEKDKKKKKKKSKSVEADSLVDDDKEKVSKKRKRSEPEEKKEETEDDEESKRRKKEENVKNDEGVQETPIKQAEVQENGNVEKSDTKSGKGLSNSKEPKKPFQRVNAEEVVFIDDRLRDNSYWGKSGAEKGYGAKAQEVLGQVKGRGFRHEKTKKKRGSYRGGEIDLESHSVKFEYSDDE